MRFDFTIEDPLRLLVLVLALWLILLEETDAVAAVRSGEVHTVLTDNEVLDSGLLVVADLELLGQLLELTSDWVNNSDETIALTDKELSTIGGEFHDGEQFIRVAHCVSSS